MTGYVIPTKWKFNVGDVVMHVKTEGIYLIQNTPNMNFNEATGEAMYAYRSNMGGVTHNRVQTEMEDGRFVLVCSAEDLANATPLEESELDRDEDLPMIGDLVKQNTDLYNNHFEVHEITRFGCILGKRGERHNNKALRVSVNHVEMAERYRKLLPEEIKAFQKA